MMCEILEVKFNILDVVRVVALIEKEGALETTYPFLLQDHEDCAVESRGRALNQMLPFNQSMRAESDN